MQCKGQRTIVICEIGHLDVIYLAIASSNHFIRKNLKRFKDREEIVFQNISMHDKWKEKARGLSVTLNTNIKVSNFVLNCKIALEEKDITI